MPSCSIKQCSARKKTNQSVLTLHRFPVDETLKKKWIEIIGIQNINPRHKMHYVCSMHFDETCFNRTLDVTRLRDGTVPDISLLPTQTGSQPTPDSQSTSDKMVADKNTKLILGQKQNISMPMRDNLNKNALLVKIEEQNQKIKKLTKRCDSFKRKVRSLNDKVRRRDVKLAIFSKIIKALQNRDLINNEDYIILVQ